MARAACCRWPSRRTTPDRGASTSTTPTSRATHLAQLPALAGNPDRADAGSRRTVIRVAPPALQPQGRPDPVRPRRPALRGLRRRRWRRRPGRQRPEPRPHPRQDRPHRPAAGGGYAIPRGQPVPRPLGRARRDLRLRPAQPLPLLVRPRAPARSTIGDVGQDAVEEIDYTPGRGRAGAAARRRQLRLGRVGGPQPLRGRHARRATCPRRSPTRRTAATARSSAAT